MYKCDCITKWQHLAKYNNSFSQTLTKIWFVIHTCFSSLLKLFFFASFVLTGYHMQRIIFSSSLCVVDLRFQNLAFVISQPSSLEWILGYYGLTRVLDLVSPYQSQDKFLICPFYPLALRFYLNTLVLRSRYRVLQRTTKATGITAAFASILTYS